MPPQQHRRHADVPVHHAPELVENHRDAVQSAPDDEVPASAVPQTAEKHHDKRIEVGVDEFAGFCSGVRELVPDGDADDEQRNSNKYLQPPARECRCDDTH